MNNKSKSYLWIAFLALIILLSAFGPMILLYWE